MRFALCLAIALLVGVNSAAGDDAKQGKPQGTTLRLELFVSDMQQSIDFYTNVLGFEQQKGQPNCVPVRSGSVLIALGPAAGLPPKHHFNPEVQNCRRGLGVEIVLEVDNVQAFFDEVNATGYKRILSPLRQHPWGLTDFRVADPDGYYLRITSR
ncbi:MAG: glyoxalase/bleomycin resistance/extradiol dioxygenase family protein [Planctomycetota bacterium]|nr:MAG: glyoxalase/bleomycin resistance/extradiol dioxygenase family protein [Planctomycetota bacterium]